MSTTTHTRGTRSGAYRKAATWPLLVAVVLFIALAMHHHHDTTASTLTIHSTIQAAQPEGSTSTSWGTQDVHSLSIPGWSDVDPASTKQTVLDGLVAAFVGLAVAAITFSTASTRRR